MENNNEQKAKVLRIRGAVFVADSFAISGIIHAGFKCGSSSWALENA